MSRILSAVIILVPLAVQAAVPLYGQCGGTGYTGETTCVAGAVCVYQNEWYSQCLAGTATTTTKTSTTTKATTTTTTKTTTTTSNGGSVPTGITFSLPASQGYKSLATASTITGTFDGGMYKYDRKGSSGDCQGQSETGEAQAVFILESGATIKNVIIGLNQAEGIHCRGPCTIQNVWWEDVCEDAATFKQTGSGDTSYVIGGGAFHAEDKIFQHNGAGTVSISNFFASDFGKLYRACGNCSTSYTRRVVVNNVALHGGSSGVGINTNFGDTAKLDKICTNGKPTDANLCCRYDGTTPGNEPVKTGCGPNTSCVYSTSEITDC